MTDSGGKCERSRGWGLSASETTTRKRVLDRRQYTRHCTKLEGKLRMVAEMSWVYVVASIFWGAAAVSVAAWFLVRGARKRARRIIDERRSFPRPPLGFRATMKLQKRDGTTATLRVRGYDLTRLGAKVISNEPLPPGSVVFLELPGFNLMGVGHILHCTAHRLKFRIGMEFRTPLMRSYEGTWAISVVEQSAEEPVSPAVRCPNPVR
jgi:PilZ domain